MFKVKDHVQATLSTGYDASATSIVLSSGHGARFSGQTPCVCVWWNSTDYPEVWDDPNVEFILIRSRSTDTLTVMRALYGNAASTKNTGGKTYKIALVPAALLTSFTPARQVMFMYDDFLHGATATPLGDTNWEIGGTGGQTIIEGDSNHRGILEINTSTSSTGARRLHKGITSHVLGGGYFRYETLVKLTALSDGTDTYIARVGLGDTLGAHTDGVYFEYTHSVNSGNWQGKTANNSTRTDVNSSVAASINWVRLAFEVNADATSVEFFIDDVSIGTSSTNIPKTAGRSCGEYYNIGKSAGTTSRGLQIDYVTCFQLFTTHR